MASRVLGTPAELAAPSLATADPRMIIVWCWSGARPISELASDLVWELDTLRNRGRRWLGVAVDRANISLGHVRERSVNINNDIAKLRPIGSYSRPVIQLIKPHCLGETQFAHG